MVALECYYIILTVLVREFEPRHGEILNIFAKIKKDQLLRERLAWVGTIGRESTREERAQILSK